MTADLFRIDGKEMRVEDHLIAMGAGETDIYALARGGNIAALQYIARMRAAGKDPARGTVLYGHVEGLGYCVSELEIMPRWGDS